MDVAPPMPTPPMPDAVEGARLQSMAFVLRSTGLAVPTPGRMWVEVIVDGQSWIGARLRIIHQAEEG